MHALKEIQTALISGDGPTLLESTEKALSQGLDPESILYEGLIPGMDVVGDKFRNDELYLPEVIQIANNFKNSVNVLKPHLMGKKIRTEGKVLIGTVKGDLHDVGKNLVSLMLEASGFEVLDLGIDVSEETFVQNAKEHDVDVVGISALLTTTMPNIQKTIQALKEDGIGNELRIIIGGAPVSQAFADEVGADAYGHDAIDAVEKIRMLLK